MANKKQNEFPNTLAHLAQHIVNISYEGQKIGRRIFVINHVGNKKRCNLTDVVKSLKLPKSTATRQVDYLVAKQLVNRKIPENNRRTVELTLTEKGKEVYAWFQEHLEAIMAVVQQEYSEQEVNLMIRILPRVIAQSEDFLKKTGHWR